jgi:hypothetical protein
MTVNPPVYQRPTLIFQSLSTALLIFSCTVFGLKLTEEKQTLAAAGFTMFAIANGIGIVIFFEMRQFSVEEYEKIYDIYSNAVTLMIPSCILIYFYDSFPRWLRIMPLVYCFIMLIVIVMFYCGYTGFNNLDQISFVGYIVMEFAQLIWGIRLWKKAVRLKAE